MKKTKMLSKIVAALLVVANLFALTSCADTSWALKAGDDTIPAGVYLGYLVDAYYTAAYSVEDTSKDIFKQEIDGVKTADYIKKTALESCKRYLAIEKLFNEYKLSFTPEEEKEFASETESIWGQISAMYEENGCGKNSFSKILLAEDKYQKVFEYYYSAEGKEPLPSAERKEYFEKNYAKIKYIAVSYANHFSNVQTSASASDKQKTELKAMADKYLERLKNGESIDKLIAEEEAFSKDEEKGDETTEVKEVEYTFIEKDTSDDPAAFNKAVFASKYNEPAVTENDTYGYYVYVRYELDAEKEYVEYDADILDSMKGDAFEKIVNKTIEQIKVTENAPAIKRYKPQNIVLG